MGILIQDVTVERRVAYFPDWEVFRGAGGVGLQVGRGWRRGFMICVDDICGIAEPLLGSSVVFDADFSMIGSWASWMKLGLILQSFRRDSKNRGWVRNLMELVLHKRNRKALQMIYQKLSSIEKSFGPSNSALNNPGSRCQRANRVTKATLPSFD